MHSSGVGWSNAGTNPEDRRTRELYLTEDGRSLIDRAFALALGHERDLCAELSDAERERYPPRPAKARKGARK